MEKTLGASDNLVREHNNQSTDIGERKNQAPEFPEIVKALTTEYKQWEAEVSPKIDYFIDLSKKTDYIKHR